MIQERICYVEDELGGLFCYEKDAEHFTAKEGAVICCQGTRQQVEEYIRYVITDNMINKIYKNTK